MPERSKRFGNSFWVHYRYSVRCACPAQAQLAFAAPLAVRRVSRSQWFGFGWIWILVVFVVLTAAIIALVFYLDRQRSKKIAAAATVLGLTFRRKGRRCGQRSAGRLSSPKKSRADSRVVSNVLQAVQTTPSAFTLFDYQYTIGYSKTSSTSQQTITQNPVAVTEPADVPSLSGNVFQDGKNVRWQRYQLSRITGAL